MTKVIRSERIDTKMEGKSLFQKIFSINKNNILHLRVANTPKLEVKGRAAVNI